MVKVRSVPFLLFLFFIFLCSTIVIGRPVLPMEVYGEARYFNMPVAQGTTITAIDFEGNPCGEFVVSSRGFFGTMSCHGRNTTEQFRGASQGEIIRFRMGNFPTSVLFEKNIEAIGNLLWEEGAFKKIVLVAPPIFCGDGFCDSFENCNTCPEDCGECEEAEGEDTVGEGRPDPSVPDFVPPVPITPHPETPHLEEECVELWECTDWSSCSPQGVQTRICIDLNECGTEIEKPETQRNCTYVVPVPPEDFERPRTEAPRVIEPCRDRLDILGFESLIFFILVALIFLVPLFYLEKQKKVLKSKKEDDVNQLVKLYSLEHKIKTFLIIASVLSFVVYLYHYFFFFLYLCVFRRIRFGIFF